MAMGKPVIVSDSTTQANVVSEENCGLVFPAEDELQLANRIIELFEDKDLTQKLGENGRNAVLNKWNWDITSKDLINMYKKL